MGEGQDLLCEFRVLSDLGQATDETAKDAIHHQPQDPTRSPIFRVERRLPYDPSPLARQQFENRISAILLDRDVAEEHIRDFLVRNEFDDLFVHHVAPGTDASLCAHAMPLAPPWLYEFIPFGRGPHGPCR